MKKMLFGVLVLIALGGVTGCDSNDDENSDAERFINAWTLTEVRDDEGDKTATFLEGYSGISASFDEAGTYTLMVDAVEQAADTTLSGPYSVNESSKTLLLTIEVLGQTLPLPLTYSFQNDETLMLSGNSVLVNPLFQTGLVGMVQLTFTSD